MRSTDFVRFGYSILIICLLAAFASPLAAQNPDDDNDGIFNENDEFDDDANNDYDGDNVADSTDNCPLTYNERVLGIQPDADGDGIGDACDTLNMVGGVDSDFDGWEDQDDNCPNWPNADQANRHAQGNIDGFPEDNIGDACTCGDINDDGVLDADDVSDFPVDPYSLSLAGLAKCDVDGDGACTLEDKGLLDKPANKRFTNTMCPSIEVVSRRALNRLGYGIDNWARQRILDWQQQQSFGNPAPSGWDGVSAYIAEQIDPSQLIDPNSTNGPHTFGDAPFAAMRYRDYSIEQSRWGIGSEGKPTIGKDIQFLRQQYCYPDNNTNNPTWCQEDISPHRIRTNTAEVKLLRSIYSKRQLTSVLLDFWFNHFNIFAGGAGMNLYGVHLHEEQLQKFMYSNFADLVWASSTTTAMLDYLDQADSNVANRNENFAREVMELHTIGLSRDTDGDEIADFFTYDKTSEQSGINIIAVTRILTGMMFSKNGGSDWEYFFNQFWHDSTWTYAFPPAEFGIPYGALGPYTAKYVTIGDPAVVTTPWVFGDWTNGAYNESCFNHGDSHYGLTDTQTPIPEARAFLCLLAQHPASADTVGRKLIKRFLGDRADFIAGQSDAYRTNADFDVLGEIEAVWAATEGDLSQVLEVLFGIHDTYTNKDFYRSLFYGDAKIKRPSVYYASLMRALGASETELMDDSSIIGSSVIVGTQYPGGNAYLPSFKNLIGELVATGEEFYVQPSPTGYSEESGAWTGAATTINHFNTAARFVYGSSNTVGNDVARAAEKADTWTVVARLNQRGTVYPMPGSGDTNAAAETVVESVAEAMGQNLEKVTVEVIANYMIGYDLGNPIGRDDPSADTELDCRRPNPDPDPQAPDECVPIWLKRAILGVVSSPEFRAH